MAMIFGQVIFLKVRRIIQFLICLLFIILILTVYSSWLLKFTNAKKIYDNALSKQTLNDIFSEQLGFGRSDLAKYIHLDLKGAPPKANKFYDSFFNFLQNLQMGVKGVLIEYEDTLPLHGNLANISFRVHGRLSFAPNWFLQIKIPKWGFDLGKPIWGK
ncbi:unnamed protein product [Rotaria magnacalcarata]|uniref:Uncharacterized protein n=1 Tax=Rotaria magnacalcarata TaxID=392030 RepID=A0A8S3HG14_9BILA|nr:unnamed protein product [Rotaria magnacalcarata]